MPFPQNRSNNGPNAHNTCVHVSTLIQQNGDVSMCAEKLTHKPPCLIDQCKASIFIFGEGGCYKHRSEFFLKKNPHDKNVGGSAFSIYMQMLICRFSLASRLQSDWMLMLFFAHTHLTVTVTVGLLLIPKVFSFTLLFCQI